MADEKTAPGADEPDPDYARSAALAHLRDLIRSLERGSREAARHAIQDLRQMETLFQNQDPEVVEQLALEVDRWLDRVPRDFAQPTFQQLFAHLSAIILSLNSYDASAQDTLRLSQRHRPDALRNNGVFLGSYLPEPFLDPRILPDFADQREAMAKIADLLVRYGVPVLPDSTPPAQFEALPVPQQVLELYKRERKIAEGQRKRAESLESTLRHAGVIKRVRKLHRNYHEFTGPNGLDIDTDTTFWASLGRLLKGIEVWFHVDPIHAENWTAKAMIVGLILLNVFLYVAFWHGQVGRAEWAMDQLKSSAIETVLPASRTR